VPSDQQKMEELAVAGEKGVTVHFPLMQKKQTHRSDLSKREAKDRSKRCTLMIKKNDIKGAGRMAWWGA